MSVGTPYKQKDKMPTMTDEEVLCEFMEAKPPEPPVAEDILGNGRWVERISRLGWWRAQGPTGAPVEWVNAFLETPARGHLGLIWEIEEKLTAGQVEAYMLALVGCTTSIAVVAEAVHSTAEQKIRALAVVIRPIVEARKA